MTPPERTSRAARPDQARRRRRSSAVLALAGLALAACGRGDDGGRADEVRAAPTAPAVTAPATTTVPARTTAPATTTVPTSAPAPPPAPTAAPAAADAAAPPVALPVPVDSPLDDRAYEPEVHLGTIAIPRLGLETTLYEGIRLTTLDRGPGHWPGSALPGQLGNVVVGGHRVTHSRPFRHIDQLEAGDAVVFTVDGTAWTYEVVGSEVVDPVAGMRIVVQTPEHTATLFACHPPGSARYRYVVHLRLAGPGVPAPAGPAAAA